MAKLKPGQEMKHGHGGYIAGCRCNICREAKKKYMKKYRAPWGKTDFLPKKTPRPKKPPQKIWESDFLPIGFQGVADEGA